MEAENSLTIPYTYYIICPDGRKYYGVRYAKGCSPEDLWNTYFTSSKEIEKLLNIFNKDLFFFEIRKIFNNTADAINHENRVIKRILGKDGWLNKNLNGSEFYHNIPHSDETKNKIRNTLLGNKHSPEVVERRRKSNTGKKRTEEFCQLMRDMNIGRKVSEETRIKQSIARTGTKRSEETRAKMREAWIRRKAV